MKFQIVSDSSCDLPKERAQELGVDIVPFYVSFEEENYMKEGVDISVEDFYQMMADRAGTFPKTSMPSVQDYVDVFEKYVKDGVPVLCICLNAAFSGSIQSAMSEKPDSGGLSGSTDRGCGFGRSDGITGDVC